MLGIAAIIICTVLAFKTARDYGRSGPLWALITFGIGAGIQWVLGFLIGLALGIVYLMSGTSPNEIQSKIAGPAYVIGFGTLILSVVVMLFILKYLGRVREGAEIPATQKAGSLGLNQ